MEEGLLQEMIRDRETSITFIEKKISDQDDKEKRLREHEIIVTETVKKNREEYRTEQTVLRQRYGTFLRQYHDTKDALDTKKAQQHQQHQQQQQHSNGGGINNSQQQAQNGGKIPNVPSLHVYNEIMNAVDISSSSSNGNGGNVVAGTDSSSNYVVRMQSQLCKAMHGMGIMETQLQLTRKKTELYKKKSKDVITGMVEEKSQAELKLVNELIVADNLRQEVETKRKLQHDSFFKEKYDLMEKIERQNEVSDNSDDNEEGDNEEEDNEEEKEELRNILEQGKEEIKRLEHENKEKTEELEALKEKAAIAQGHDVVDDIVTSIAEEFAERDDDDSYD